MKKINELFFLRPWLIKEDILNVMVEVLERRIKGEKLSEEDLAARVGSDKRENGSYEVINGIARIPIYGVIAKRMNMVNNISQPRGTSVEEIKGDFLNALNDSKVTKILLDVDSPGGSVDGIDELSELIFNSRGKKPIMAYGDGQMCSAAYYIASAADQVYASKSSEVGSIGVYTVIRDLSVAEHNAGIKTEIIKAGRYKAAGHPSKGILSDEERQAYQEEVNAYYDLFVEAIGRNRSLTKDRVLNIADGKVLIGKKALNSGLIDGIDSLDSFFDHSSKSTNTKIKTSAEEHDGVYIDSNEDNLQNVIKAKKEEERMELTLEVVKSDHKLIADQLVAEGKAVGLEEGKKQGEESAKSAEKNRISGIINSMPQGMEALALIAIKDGLSPESAKDKFLAEFKSKTPPPAGLGGEEIAVPAKTHLDRATQHAQEHKCSMTEALKATASKRAK